MDYLEVDSSTLSTFTLASENQDYFLADFNGDNRTDWLIRGISDTNTGYEYFSGDPQNGPVTYQRLVVEDIAVSVVSTGSDEAPQVLQTYTSSSFATANINTAPLNIQDVDGDGRDDIVLTANSGDLTVWLAEANGNINLSQYQLTTDAIQPAKFTGTSAGEFEVSESGAATYNIKLTLPRGTAGVQPSLALSYVSNGGNGLLGKGWSISGLSAISRCRQTKAVDNNIDPIKWNSNDRFCLDGQRLILVEGSSTYGAPGTLYKTELDAYTQVMAVGGTTGSPSYFKVLRKDGSVTFYGNTSDSRHLAGPHVLAWAQSRMQDNIGNGINFIYYNDSAGHRIKSIRYAYGTSASVHNAEVNFSYSNRPDYIDGYISGYSIKNQKRLRSIEVRNNVDGQWHTVRDYNLHYAPIQLHNPLSLFTAFQECVEGQCMAATEFDWNLSSATIQYQVNSNINGTINNYTEADRRFFDVNGDGYLDLFLLNQSDNYSVDSESSDVTDETDRFSMRYFVNDGVRLQPASFTNGTQQFDFIDTKRGAHNLAPHDKYVKTEILDYNGDGKQDIAIFRTQVGHWQILLSEPTSDGWRLSLNPIDLNLLNHINYTFVDMNGDGLADAVSPTKIFYLTFAANSGNLNTPYNYSTAHQEVMNLPSFGINQACYSWGDADPGPGEATSVYQFIGTAGDTDGDGDVEMVVQRLNKCFIEGRVNVNKREVLVEKQGSQFAHKLNFDSGERQIQLADVNGDGLADLTYNRDHDERSRWYYQLSTGNGFLSRVEIDDTKDEAGPQFADINGDGKLDFIWRGTGSKGNRRDAYYRLFIGNAYQPKSAATKFLNEFLNGSSRASNAFIDINGDRRADIVASYEGDIDIRMSTPDIQPNSTIVKITNGLGAETNIHYETLAGSGAYTPADFELSYRYVQEQANTASRRVNCDGISCVNETVLVTGDQLELEQQQHADIARGYWDLPDGAQIADVLQPVMPINGAIFVVTRVDSAMPAASETQAGAINTNAQSAVAYQYAGARIQASGRGFLGFQYLKSIDLQTNIKTTTLYRQDYPFIGAPLKTTVFSPDGKVMKESENIWTFVTGEGSDGTRYYQTLLSQATENHYQVNTSEQTGDITVTNSLIKTVTTQNTFDAFGNPEQMINTTQGYGEHAVTQVKTSENTYSDNSLTIPAWGRSVPYAALGRLTAASVTTQQNGQVSTRHTAFDYYTRGNLAGLLRTETVEPNGSQAETHTTTHYYDAVGNETRSVSTGWDGQAITERSARTEYDSTGRYIDASYNHYGQQVEQVLERDPRGAARRSQDLAGIITTVDVDTFGRELRRYDDSSDESVTSEYLFCHQLGNCPSGATYAIRQTTASGGQSITYFDILGRKTREGKISFDGRWIYSDIEYDSLGRTLRQSTPFFAHTVPKWTRNYYDVLGRPYYVTAPDGNHQRIRHSGLASTTTNALGQSKTKVSDVLDQLKQVTDHFGGRIRYEYNIDGELTHMHSYRANQSTPAATTVLEYDDLGRKTRMIDPDKGTWVYQYNAFGELIEQTDAKQQRVIQRYDALGRMISRTDYRSNNSVEGHTTWVYDNNTRSGREFDNARGQLREVILSQNITHSSCFSTTTQQCIQYEYDDIGRQMASEVRLGTAASLGSFRNAVEYDRFGRPEIAYDALSDRVISNGSAVLSGTQTRYNLYGFAFQTIDLQTGDALHTILERDQRDQVLEERRGNGVTTTYRYDDANGRLLHQQTTSALGYIDPIDVQDIGYEWDLVGNLKSRHNQSANGQGGQKNLQESFCYDGLNRLIKTHKNSLNGLCDGLSATEQDLEYDSLGNITRKHDVGTYTYGSVYNTSAANDAGLHAVTATSDGLTYHYDNNGNMTEDRRNGSIERALSYTTFDKPDEISKGDHTTRFSYGHDRSRYWRQDTNAQGVVTTTLYLGGVERITRSNSSNIEWKRYLGHSIHTIVTDANEVQQSLERLFVYKDHLGSTDVITDLSGQVVQSMSFDPWGQRRDATTWNAFSNIQLTSFDHSKSSKGFTGHEHLDEVGLIHMNGRIYDPRLARFLQADPMMQSPDDTQMLNRYSYTRNNPLNATDPSGYVVQFIVPFMAGVLTYGTTYYVAAVVISSAISSAVMAYMATGSGTEALKAGVVAGLSAYAFSQIGQSFNKTGATNAAAEAAGTYSGPQLYTFGSNSLTAAQIAQQITAHGLVGGIGAEIQGGKFGHGFISAGLTKGVMGTFSYANTSGGAVVGRTLVAALVGGTVSELTGGKFGNGAATAAIAHLMNAEGPSASKDFSLQAEGGTPHRYTVGPTTLCELGSSQRCNLVYGLTVVNAEAVPFVGMFSGDPKEGTMILLGNNPITRVIDRENYAVWNITQEGHDFHPGTVRHQLYIEDGKIKLFTEGLGTGKNPNFNNLIGWLLMSQTHTSAQIQMHPGFIGDVIKDAR